jgi:hypothetical protein
LSTTVLRDDRPKWRGDRFSAVLSDTMTEAAEGGEYREFLLVLHSRDAKAFESVLESIGAASSV